MQKEVITTEKPKGLGALLNTLFQSGLTGFGANSLGLGANAIGGLLGDLFGGGETKTVKKFYNYSGNEENK